MMSWLQWPRDMLTSVEWVMTAMIAEGLPGLRLDRMCGGVETLDTRGQIGNISSEIGLVRLKYFLEEQIYLTTGAHKFL